MVPRTELWLVGESDFEECMSEKMLAKRLEKTTELSSATGSEIQVYR